MLTGEEEDEEDDHLEERHVEDVLAHLARDNEVVLALRHAVQKLGAGQLSGEGQRREGVHDHVNPEELDSLQRRLLQEDSTDHGEEEGVDVDGQLELEEASDVVIDVATPHASLDD